MTMWVAVGKEIMGVFVSEFFIFLKTYFFVWSFFRILSNKLTGNFNFTGKGRGMIR